MGDVRLLGARAVVLIAAYLQHGWFIGFADNARANAKLNHILSLDEWGSKPSWAEFRNKFSADILWVVIWDVVEKLL